MHEHSVQVLQAHSGPQPVFISDFLNFIQDWSAWGPWWKESHRVTDVGRDSELSTVKRCVFTPRPNKCQFQPFSLKMPIFYKVVTCDIFPKFYYKNILTKKMNTAIHAPKWLKFKKIDNTNIGMDMKEPEISYTAPGTVSRYSHFGKMSSIIHKSSIYTHPETTNLFLTISQQHFINIFPQEVQTTVIHRNLAIFTETKEWIQSKCSLSEQWYIKIKYYLATKMNNLQLHTKYGHISQT